MKMLDAYCTVVEQKALKHSPQEEGEELQCWNTWQPHELSQHCSKKTHTTTHQPTVLQE